MLNSGMDTNTYEARRAALKRLIDKLGRGGIATVADRIGRDPSYVSRLLYEPGKSGRKQIGDTINLKLESAFPGWLGEENQKTVATATINVRISEAGLSTSAAKIVRMIRELDAAKQITPEVASAVITLLKPLQSTPVLALAADPANAAEKYAGVAEVITQGGKPKHPLSNRGKQSDAK